MQDGHRILGSGKSGKMAKKYQHHKFPSCLGNPNMRERTRRILHTFSDITPKSEQIPNKQSTQIRDNWLFTIKLITFASSNKKV